MPLSELISRLGAAVNDAPAPVENAQVTQQLSSLLVSIRRHLHTHPEVGFQEYETAAFIREMLEMHGLEPSEPLAGTGLFVDIEGTSDGPSVGYRADIDALPISDEKSTSYKSINAGVAHLCGHDAHTTIAIGAAILLHNLRESIAGKVRVFFQPNEEGMPSGAPRMIADGVLEGLEAVYAMHVDPTLEAGRFGLLTGPITAAADQFKITIRGESTGHSARPHQYADTIWIATQVANTLYQILGRVTDARNPAVLTICRIHGGDAYNVIPSRVELGGTLRSTSPEERETIKKRIRDSAEMLASSCGATADIEIHSGSPAVVNDPRLIGLVERVIVDSAGRAAVHWVPVPSMGSEDFAHYVQHVPGAMIRIGTSSSPETSHTLHDSCFDLDESVLAPGAQLAARMLMAHLRERPLSSRTSG